MTFLLPLAGIVVTAILGAVTAYRAPDRRLARLDVETQVLARLNANTDAAKAVREVVDEHARQLRADLHMRRDLRGSATFFGVYFVLALAGLVTIDRSNQLWADSLGFAAIGLALACLVEGVRRGERRPRNPDGSPRT